MTFVTGNRKSQTADEQGFNVKTAKESSHHMPTHLGHNTAEYAETEHQPTSRRMKYDLAVSFGELLLVIAQTTEYDHSSSSILNSGD